MILIRIIVCSLYFILISNSNGEVVSVIKKGTILTCPKNNEEVIEVEKDITLYTEIGLDNFKFLKEYPSTIEKTIPCEIIKELCFHVDNRWIGFSSDCELIPKNAGTNTYKEFIDGKLKEKSDRLSIVTQEMSCKPYKESKEISICVTKDKKWKCIKSIMYKNSNNIGPCTENKD